MRLKASVSALVVVVGAGCSSAASLPSGGPYGGGAYDASPPDAASTIAFNPGGTNTSGLTTGTASTGTFTVGPSTTGIASSGPTGVATTGATTSATVASSTATSSASPSVPTWTYLFNTYLTDATATIGDCDGTCHYHSECDTVSDCYAWIGSPAGQRRNGSLSNGGELFTWDRGYMPKGGPTTAPQAEADFAAWIAAGSLDD